MDPIINNYTIKNNNAVINEKKIILKDKLVELVINNKIRPKWLSKHKNIIFVIPAVYENFSKDGVLAYFTYKHKRYPAISLNNKNKITFNFNPEKAINFILNEEHCSKKRPIYTYLPFHYHKIPLREKIYKTLKKRKNSRKNFPDWPIDNSADILKEICINSLRLNKKIKTKRTWPNKAKFAIVISHDIDSKQGFSKIKEFLEIEKEHGIKASWNIVLNYFRLDYALLDRMVKEEHEICSHGYNHDNKIAYLGEKGIKKRFEKQKNLIKQYEIKGFRSPSLLVSKKLFQVAQDYFVYDSSIPDTEVTLTDSERRGCCSIFPFFINNLVEIPITMPMDASLIFMGYKPDEILNLWKEKLNLIKDIGGVAVFNIHPEPRFSGNKKMMHIFEKLLEHLKNEDAWFATSGEVAEFWRKTRR
ncbi:MAG: polysaccharide deacetylase family protein [Candidatus Thorarchaeota archaeon]